MGRIQAAQVSLDRAKTWQVDEKFQPLEGLIERYERVFTVGPASTCG